jgi:type I restriction enzyme M protein
MSIGAGQDRLITRAQIGILAGVARPTVTAWGREPGFPEPVRAGDTDFFRQADIFAWLDTRPVPRRLRHVSEPADATYGDRAREALRGQEDPAVVDVADALVPQRQHGGADRRRVRELMGELADRVRGAGSVINYMNLVLCLHFLHGVGGPQWEAVERRAGTGRGSDGARALLDQVGAATDDRLKLLGMVPGMRQELLQLEPRTYDDLKSVVKHVGQLGRGAFGLVLAEYELRAGLRSGEFFTPRGVVCVMTEIAGMHCEGQPQSIYDPYARGGELLAESVAACVARGADPSRLDVRGDSHRRDTARLALMNLALQGARPRVRLTNGAPWNAVTGPRDAARADLILTNPPFNMNDSAGEPRLQGTWPYGAPPSGNDNFAYVQHVLAALSKTGCAAMVMPNKAGNSANPAEVRIRRNMVESGVVKCVIALPDRLFSSTPVPVSVWILVHPSRGCDEVVFLDARRLGSKHKGKRVLREDDVRAVIAAYRSALTSRASDDSGAGWEHKGVETAVVTRAGLQALDHSLSPTDHIRSERTSRESAGTALARAVREVEDRRREVVDADAAALLADIAHWRTATTECRTVDLKDLCTIKAGPSYSVLGADQRTPDGEVPLVFPKYLDRGRILDPGDRRVPAALAERLNDYRLEPGDIVCVRSGTIGPPALVRDAQSGWLMSTNVLRLRVREGVQADPEYLLAFLSRPDAVAWVRDRATATGAPSISARALGNQQVLLPAYDEQRRISQVLAALEDQAAAHIRFAAAVSDARAAMTARLLDGQ